MAQQQQQPWCPFQAAKCATLRQTRLLLKHHPEVATCRDVDNKKLPLHYVLERCCEGNGCGTIGVGNQRRRGVGLSISSRRGSACNNWLDLVQEWYNAYPEGAVREDINGRTPFQALLRSLFLPPTTGVSVQEEQSTAFTHSSGTKRRRNAGIIGSMIDENVKVLQFMFDVTLEEQQLQLMLLSSPTTSKKKEVDLANTPFHNICEVVSQFSSCSISNSNDNENSMGGHATNLLRVEDDNDVQVSPCSATTTSSLLYDHLLELFRSRVQIYPQALFVINAQGMTPLMLLIQNVPLKLYNIERDLEDSLQKSLDILELQIDKRDLLRRSLEQIHESNRLLKLQRDVLQKRNRLLNERRRLLQGLGSWPDKDDDDDTIEAIERELRDYVDEVEETERQIEHNREEMNHSHTRLRSFATKIVDIQGRLQRIQERHVHEFSSALLIALPKFRNHNIEEVAGSTTFSTSTTNVDATGASSTLSVLNEARLLQAAYEGAISAILMEMQEDEQPQQTGPKWSSSSSKSDHNDDDDDDNMMKDHTSMSYTLKNGGGSCSTAPVFAVHFLSLFGAAFHHKDWNYMLRYFLEQIKTCNVEDTNDFLNNSLLHNFLRGLHWKYEGLQRAVLTRSSSRRIQRHYGKRVGGDHLSSCDDEQYISKMGSNSKGSRRKRHYSPGPVRQSPPRATTSRAATNIEEDHDYEKNQQRPRLTKLFPNVCDEEEGDDSTSIGPPDDYDDEEFHLLFNDTTSHALRYVLNRGMKRNGRRARRVNTSCSNNSGSSSSLSSQSRQQSPQKQQEDTTKTEMPIETNRSGHSHRDHPILSIMETLMKVKPDMAHNMNTRGELPLHIALKCIPRLAKTTNTTTPQFVSTTKGEEEGDDEEDENNKKSWDLMLLDVLKFLVMANADSCWMPVPTVGLSYRRGSLYPFMLASLAAAPSVARPSSSIDSPTYSSETIPKKKKQRTNRGNIANKIITTTTTTGDSYRLNATYYLLQQFLSSRTL